MGAGKSSVGRRLAPLLGWSFFDADLQIVKTAGSTIERIFVDRGEAHFRTLEAQVVARLLQERHAVIALGGGALESPDTQGRLQTTAGTCLVYLRTSLATSLARCTVAAATGAATATGAAAAVRPILQDQTLLEQRYRSRLAAYEQAHLTVDTEGATPAQLADAIAGMCRGRDAS